VALSSADISYWQNISIEQSCSRLHKNLPTQVCGAIPKGHSQYRRQARNGETASRGRRLRGRSAGSHSGLDEDPARAALAPDYPPSEATGYSKAWDFAEAFRDAIGKLPPGTGAKIPDWLYTYEVILLVYSPKSHNQLAGARAANRERRVMAVGTPSSQLAIRPTLTAVAVASS
jgi:hypothetical protein